MKTLHFLLKPFVFFVASCFFFVLSASAQITFQKTFGGTGYDECYSVQQTSDGGYIVAGNTDGFGAGFWDIYLIKTDANGDTLWTKTLGEIGYDNARSVQQTNDGGFIIGGYHNSFGLDDFDIYLIKTDANGNPLWTKTFGGPFDDYGGSVQQTADGGYIITGYIGNLGAGDADVYLIKTDANGDSLWTKTFGGINENDGYSVHQTIDGGYIITGETNSFGAGGFDVYLIKTDSIGNLLWSKTFGGTGDDIGFAVQQTTDGGYIITGYKEKLGGFIHFDVYLIKTDTMGNLLWSKTFGGTGDEVGFGVQQTTDGGYIISGFTASFGTVGYADVYLIKADVNGNLLWSKIFGGSNDDLGNSVQQTTDGGYIVTGYSRNFGAGGYADVYLIKTDSSGNSGCNEGNPATIVITPSTQVTTPATIAGSPPDIVTSPATIVGSAGIVTTLCTTVGISEITADNSFIISPIPSPGNFTITFTNAINRGEVQIFNAYGSIVFSQNIHNTSNTEIHLKHIPSGIYFVKIWNGEKYFSNKIIIQKG
ncbi:MAG TPA: T9SS type A sorting domain-containing protein [Bacteroidia bacterium]|nr:T9SS type A sorting domain-containing protein [Bacteroidia bacterium]